MINCGAQVFLRLPFDFYDVCSIYPPKVIDVIGLREFPQYRVFLTITHEDIEDQFFPDQEIDEKVKLPTPFEYILEGCKNPKSKKIIEDAIYYFTHEKVTIDVEEKVIFIGDLEKKILEMVSLDEIKVINEENFFDFQNAIRVSVGEEPREEYLVKGHPRLRKMKAKARYRDRVKASKGDGMTLEDSLLSICCMGIGLNPLNIGEISYASMSKLLTKFQQKERYDIDIRSLIAGADAKKVKPQYWMNKFKKD